MSTALCSYATQFIRRVYFEAQDGLCGICGHNMAKKGSRAGNVLGFDHVWPRSRSAARNKEQLAHGNLVLAHTSCNLAKANRRPTAGEIATLYRTNRRIGLPTCETLQWDRPELMPASGTPYEIGANENEPEHHQRGDAAAQRAE